MKALTWILSLNFALEMIDENRAVVFVLDHFPTMRELCAHEWRVVAWTSDGANPWVDPRRRLLLVVDKVRFACPRIFSRVGNFP